MANLKRHSSDSPLIGSTAQLYEASKTLWYQKCLRSNGFSNFSVNLQKFIKINSFIFLSIKL